MPVQKNLSKAVLNMNWKHALLEISLIVIGILIALQIDNWNEERKESQFEKKILSEIAIALQGDIDDQINTRIERANEIKSSSAIVLSYIREEIAYHDSLERHFTRSKRIMIFEPKTAPFETLNSKGIELVQNDELRVALLDLYDFYYPQLEFFTAREREWTERHLGSFVLNHFRIDDNGFGYRPLYPEKLKTDFLYRNLMIEKNDGVDDLIFRFEIADKKIQNVLRLIESELD